jgi:VWFA-related protein
VSAQTRHGGGTKITKLTKITKSPLGFVVFVTLVAFVPRPSGVSGQAPQPSQRPPVFRAGANYVRVDAYPTLGREIIPNLTKDDFEIFEDGKPQTIAAAESVTFGEPDDARGSMLSPREGLELASDPHYRVVIFVIDRAVFDLQHWQSMREDLRDFLESQAGPRDLVGLITTDRPWTDLVLGRRIQSIVDEIDTPEWLHARPQEATEVLNGCGLDGLQGRIRADETYGLLENIIKLLAQVRDDRTNLVFISAGLTRMPADTRWTEPRPPTSLLPPKMGLVNGRIQRIPQVTDMHDRACKAEGHRLADTDFDRRFGELVAAARAANVTFYPVAMPMPVLPMPGSAPGLTMAGRGALPPRTIRVPTALVDLARGTDGHLVTGDDVRDVFQRLVADTGPHYLLGYYTTNSKRDGKVRSIRVQLKPYGNVIQSRRFYRAPGGKENADTSTRSRPGESIGPPLPVATALGALSRLRSSTQFFTYGAVAGNTVNVAIEVPPAAVEAGRWKDGAALEVLAETDNGEVVGTARGRLSPNGRATLRVPIDGGTPPTALFVRLRADGESVLERTSLAAAGSALVGDPQVFRSGPRALAVPVALFEFERDDRMKLDWPILAPLDRVEIRLLDRNGQPLRHKLAVKEQKEDRRLIAELSFTALGRGDYVVELTATAAAQTEQKLLAFRLR